MKTRKQFEPFRFSLLLSLHLHAHFPRGDAFQIIHRVVIDDGGKRAVQFGNFGFVFIAESKSPPLQVDVLSLTEHFFQVCLVVCYVFFHLRIFNYIVTCKCR